MQPKFQLEHVQHTVEKQLPNTLNPWADGDTGHAPRGASSSQRPAISSEYYMIVGLCQVQLRKVPRSRQHNAHITDVGGEDAA